MPSAPAPETSTELRVELASILGAEHIDDLTRLSGGASRETWRFRADGRPLVVQRQRGGDERDMSVEARVLRAVTASGAPLAELVASGVGASGASYIVSAAVEGETIARKILRDDRFASAREHLPAQLGEALARIHTIDPDGIDGVVDVDQLELYRVVLDEFGAPHPAFELAFRWLEDHRPPPTRRTLVHGDFRLGNVMVDEHGLRAVLDWELVHAGDPMEDLGWLCVRAWRFGGQGPVAGLGRYEQLFEAYEAESGLRVDPEVVHWWEVLGTLKWGIMCIGQAETHLSGRARSHELAAIGRRVCENEYDLFLALEGRW
ncbi:MAG: phosphotransferase family protein [Ilumatobacter sp.]|nr:MAG: phosphotransferase family protein [Ilumatobacter sp.]